MNPMNTRTTIALLTIASFFGACSTPARRIETGGTSSITTVGDVDIQDIKGATSEMLSSLLELGVLGKAQNKPARLLVGRIVNDTSSEFSIEDLTYGIREQLVNSGQAQVNTTYGSDAESKQAQDAMKRKQFETGESVVIENDFELTGKITQLKRSAGDVKQTTFTFRLTLTATSGPQQGLEVWTKQSSFTKQGTKSSVGF